MLLRTLKTLALATLASAAGAAGAVTIVDVDARAHASLSGANALTIGLGEGRYQLRFTDGLFTAYNANGRAAAGCDRAGANCRFGWQTETIVTLHPADGSAATSFAIGSPVLYRTPEGALAALADRVFELVVPAGGAKLSFHVRDDSPANNRGGVSLAIAGAVPEPATWAMLIAGFGLVGAAARRRRQAVVAA
ncbi:MAG: PEPxxWA-CTERM sorting domain-containing protein [Thermaurantiacus tibetensis]|uniref:PEPxxWA-CTERM sorting domain-containing protein n=1 Tax=Thermaurantiacus tibetensis TaxID=2759035 RepID=UPI001F2ED44A|nr:PEPxxWA-CTERM sorting domain-containing protein [Thermaurantiacus tibetensis]